MATALLDRFWSKVAKDGPDDCWLWTDRPAKTGYGRLSTTREQGPVLAHRLSLEIHLGRTLAPDEHVDHLCRVRMCVNPAHLEVVTIGENNRRAWEHVRRKTCPQGHDDWGLRWQKKTQTYVRRCMECHRQRERAR